MATQPPLLLLQKTMVVVEGVQKTLSRNKHLEVSKPVLEDWLKSIKSPKSTFDTAVKLHQK